MSSQDERSGIDTRSKKEVFYSLENKFNVFWEKESPLLTEWQKKLNNELNNPSSADRVLEILKVLFNTSPTESGIAILLLPSSPKHTGGGANIGNKNITLEISRYPLEEAGHAICLIWHEVIHLCFQKPYFSSLVSSEFQNDRNRAEKISEAAVRSLFPRGILSIRMFKNKPANKLIPEASVEQSIAILNLTKEYVDRKRTFDKEYVHRLDDILET